VKARK